MKKLETVRPTAEQLQIIGANDNGNLLIRGAAGSGKTTTALIRLKTLTATWVNRRRRLKSPEPVKVLVLTFNRTLKAYIEDMAKEQLSAYGPEDLTLEVSTFAKIAHRIVGCGGVGQDAQRVAKIRELSRAGNFELDVEFICDEIDYLQGRFLPDSLESYLDETRIGRGSYPRVLKPLRDKILEEIVYPYGQWKESTGFKDWNDIAIELIDAQSPEKFDIVIADECQDFSANQIRAIKNLLKQRHSLTLVLDATQRIYPRGFTWHEVGIDVDASNAFRLRRNERNTKQIARLAKSLIDGLKLDDDGTIPDFDSCNRQGPIPNVLVGKFEQQLSWVVNEVLSKIDLEKESVAFLHPKGGGWFKRYKEVLSENDIAYEEITKLETWPDSDCNVALCTLHSSKGLEFDHVVIIGLNQELTPHGTEDDDSALTNLRRLLAMGVGRAKKTVTLGYRTDQASTLFKYLDKKAYKEVDLDLF